MSKIFPPAFRTGDASFLKRPFARILFFAGALVMLWLASSLRPPERPLPADTTITPGGTTTVSGARAESDPVPRPPNLFSPGYLLVLALLGGGIGLAVHLRRRANGGSSPETQMRTLGRMQIAPQQQLRLVACGEDVLLLGVGAGQITLLKTYPRNAFPPPEAAAASPEPETDPSVARIEPFVSVLRRFAHSHVNAQAS